MEVRVTSGHARYGLAAALAAVVALAVPALGESNRYPWMAEHDARMALCNRVKVPDGYARVVAEPGCFAHWLQHLPLRPGRPSVRLYDGSRKANQDAHHAVIDLDVGELDLQQCADAVIRLRAEYLYSIGMYEAIHFNFTSGDRADYGRWVLGYRPVVAGDEVRWRKAEAEDRSYAGFRRYLHTVFQYAGTASLSRELRPVADPLTLRIGDVFIQGGFPGHAAIVVDRAADEGTGRAVFLLAQSYMPAQEMHILKNPTDARLSPWYPADFGETLVTPEWTFAKGHLRRFKAIHGETKAQARPSR